MHDSISVPIASLDESLPLPDYAYEGDGGFDVRASEAAILEPFERKTISCGFALAIPSGYAGLVIPRSGLASEHGITVVNGPGLVDSGYRGEVKVILMNLDPRKRFVIEKGDRIAQMVIIALPSVTLDPTNELSQTERGSRGFGSSGLSR